jgi:hypothetical protein
VLDNIQQWPQNPKTLISPPISAVEEIGQTIYLLQTLISSLISVVDKNGAVYMSFADFELIATLSHKRNWADNMPFTNFDLP